MIELLTSWGELVPVNSEAEEELDRMLSEFQRSHESEHVTYIEIE